jgi:alkanesulfonate monooxygenase
MPVEFLGIGATNDGTETHARSGPAFDPEYTPGPRQSRHVIL